jgi:hypothetical protein
MACTRGVFMSLFSTSSNRDLEGVFVCGWPTAGHIIPGVGDFAYQGRLPELDGPGHVHGQVGAVERGPFETYPVLPVFRLDPEVVARARGQPRDPELLPGPPVDRRPPLHLVQHLQHADAITQHLRVLPGKADVILSAVDHHRFVFVRHCGYRPNKFVARFAVEIPGSRAWPRGSPCKSRRKLLITVPRACNYVALANRHVPARCQNGADRHDSSASRLRLGRIR